MKKLLTFALLAFTVLAGCKKDDPAPEPEPKYEIRATGLKPTAERVVTLYGSGTATIDWGDGFAPQEVTLNALPANLGDAWDVEYGVVPPYTSGTYDVTVTGAGVTGAIFFDFGITALDVSEMPGLKFLDCEGNGLTALDLTKNAALTYLECDENSLTALDVGKCAALTHLQCNENSLTALDVSKNTALEHLYCGNNSLTTLDVSKNAALTFLSCSINKLASLDVAKNTALAHLSCYSNVLTSLTLGTHASLKFVDCSENRLDRDALLAVLGKLPDRTGKDGGEACCGGATPESANPGYALLTDYDREKAWEKNWLITNW